MMVPKRSLLVASAALLCFGTVASAQSKHTQKLRRVTKPLIQADLDLSTGKYTIGSKVDKKLGIFNTSRSFTNVDFSGFVGIDSVQCEWIDVTDKSAPIGGKSEIMTSFLFAYCSSALAVNSGGVGGSATVSFLEGYMEQPPIGTARPSFASRTAVYNLSGLPANTANSSFFGGFNCFFIRIRTATQNPSATCSFSGGQALSDGLLGWGWDFRDLSLFPPLAHTFAFLACVQSCSGVGPDGQNMTDGVDQYCGNFPNNPPFNLLASFTFGTTTTFTSSSMEIREANTIVGSTATYNPPFPGFTNPVILTNVNPPSIKGLGLNQLDCTAASAAKPYIVRYEFAPGNAPILTHPCCIGNILIRITAGTGRNFIFPNHNRSVRNIPLFIPLNLRFYNVSYQTQGFCGDNPKGFLSNALNQTVGK